MSSSSPPSLTGNNWTVGPFPLAETESEDLGVSTVGRKNEKGKGGCDCNYESCRSEIKVSVNKLHLSFLKSIIFTNKMKKEIFGFHVNVFRGQC